MALLLAAGSAAADDAPPPPAPANPQATPAAGSDSRDASNLVLAAPQKDYVPQPPTDSDGVTRSVSPDIAAALSSGLPKYTPPTPEPTPVPASQQVDMRDIDKPKNEIKRLPSYVVHEKRPPVFRDTDLFNANGLLDLSFKSHSGLVFGNLLGLNSYAAKNMYLDAQRQANMNDLADTARAMAVGGDSAEGSYIMKESQDTYLRHDDDWSRLNDEWNWSGPNGGSPGRPQ